MSLKAKIEAVLFLTAKPIKAQAMARIVNADVQLVRQALLELVHDYEERQGGLEIADEDGYSFQVKDEYANLMDEFLPVEMSAALIRTLSAVAIKQPISQAEIIRVRGAGAYEHIRELTNRDLIAKREEQGGGRSPILSTTKKFQEYFRLTKDGKDLRNFLKKEVKKVVAAEDALAAGQLSIVHPETDLQLNNRIFLETADMVDAALEEMEIPVAAEAGMLEGSQSGVGVSEIEPVAFDAVTMEPLVSESAGSTDLPPAPVVETKTAAAANTLSKLAEAAEVKEPQPLPAVNDEQAATTAKAKDEETDKATRPATASKSGVSAQSAKSGPPLGNNGKKKRTSGLSDLLRKQKDLERALKQAQDQDVEQTVIDFSPFKDGSRPADKNLPS
jgi:segregation and condensation protein B